MENMKQIVKEKDVIISNHREKIKELENQIAELETLLQQERSQESRSEQSDMEQRIKDLEEYSQMPTVVMNYEKFISEITSSHEIMKQERNLASSHLASLEYSFADLLEKYERLKKVVAGYQHNQEVLLDQLEVHKDAVQILQQRYEDFKDYANEKINEANEHIEKQDKRHISELAKVKSKVLQSKVKISELEKTISIMSTNANIGDTAQESLNKQSPFLPLSTNF